MKQMTKPDDWDDTPVAEQVLTCPVCGNAFLEMGPAKTHFSKQHGIKYDESQLSEQDWKRHLD